jgi:glycine cleavage system H protein
VSGKVLEFNTDLDSGNGDNPALINQDPYESGWIIKIEMTNPEELEELLSAAEYQKLVN